MKKYSIIKLFSIITLIIIALLFIGKYIFISNNETTISLIDHKKNASAKEVFDSQLTNIITPQNYGDWAEYKVDLNDDGLYTNDWKIFYNDGTHVFLIAADYLNNSKIPEEAGITTTGTYNVHWDSQSSYADKEGMNDVSEQVANKFMLEKYKNEYGDVTDINSKATAVLLDTNVWKNFALGFEGSFAYGSPTVEMWNASWNQKGYGS